MLRNLLQWQGMRGLCADHDKRRSDDRTSLDHELGGVQIGGP
jgi:hypothetical protein